jgi:hypothetical protein
MMKQSNCSSNLDLLAVIILIMFTLIHQLSRHQRQPLPPPLDDLPMDLPRRNGKNGRRLERSTKLLLTLQNPLKDARMEMESSVSEL